MATRGDDILRWVLGGVDRPVRGLLVRVQSGHPTKTATTRRNAPEGLVAGEHWGRISAPLVKVRRPEGTARHDHQHLHEHPL